MIYNWSQIGITEITNLYLYGQLRMVYSPDKFLARGFTITNSNRDG